MPSRIIGEAYPEDLRPVSTRSLCVAGLTVTVYGLEELSKDQSSVACLWLLHPRLCDQSYMQPIAASAISKWNNFAQKSEGNVSSGLIAVSFDQRNHATREVDKRANHDWMSGNESHAQDMFAGYHGTACDASHLLTYLPSYLFPSEERRIIDNFVCGVSLGGHAAWLNFMSDRRFTAAIVVVGCPDYISLLSDRAHQSVRPTAGATFVGSKDFPESLVNAVGQYDPAGLLLGVDHAIKLERLTRGPRKEEKALITRVMSHAFRGKRILNLAGADDELVPYKCAEPFLRWLKRVCGPGGSFEELGLHIEDIVFENVGHWLSPDMAEKVDAFIIESMRIHTYGRDRDPRL